jgi:DNA-binding SARP family transcriptional activator
VELCLAGPFAVLLDGGPLTDGEVGSRKARTLLKLLAVERPALVPGDRIADVLWEGAAPAGADRNIATLVSRLRAVLGPDVIRGGRPGYQLGDAADVNIDLDEAARLCEQAKRRLAASPALALAAAERAADLLSGGVALADEPDASWADPARDELRQLLRRARLTAAEAALATGDAGQAMRHAGASVAADSLDEAACRWYMSAAAAAGEQATALLAYERLRERLRDELGVDPAPQTREVHLGILREENPQPAAAAPGPASPGLAGRDREIAALRAAWGSAVGGQSSLVMICGEAGIGKTTLAEFLAAEAARDGATVLAARCYETERSLFLQPFAEALTPVVSRMTSVTLRELLGPHAGAAATLLPAVAALLGPEPPGRGSAEIERRRAFEAAAALVRGLAESNPVLVVVDDLQYGGQSTIELLHFFARQLASSRLLIVVTVRSEHPEISAALGPVAATIAVGPLDAAAVGELARDAGQGDLADDILQRTRGHTLFVVEVLRALRGGDAGLPPSLRDAVLARVRRAGPRVETLVRAACVVGAAVDPLLLGAMLGLPSAAALDQCEQAMSARLLTVSGRHYEFANDLIREAIYASLPEPTRLAYHQQAADLLTAQPEALAGHAAACGDWPRAARAWLLAVDEAMRRFASDDALILADRALDAAERGANAEVAVRARIARGRAHEAVGAHADALADFSAGAEYARAAGDRRQEMQALRELGGDAPVALGLPVSYCESHLALGLQIAESLGDRSSQADLLARLAIVAANRLQIDLAADLGRRAVTVAHAAGDDLALAAALDGLKQACLSLGDADGLRSVLAELEPLVRGQGDLLRVQWAEFDSAFLSFAAADWDAAEERIRAAIRTNHNGGYPHCASWYTVVLSLLAALRGRDADALALARRALELSRQHNWWVAASSGALAAALVVTGERAEAIELLEHGLGVAEKDGAEAYVLFCLAPLAELTGSMGLLARADSLLAGAASPAGAWIPGYETFLSVGRAWLAAGQPDRARAVLAPLLAVADRTPWTPVLARTLVVSGRALTALGHDGEARSALTRAGRLAADHGMPPVGRDAASALRELR